MQLNDCTMNQDDKSYSSYCDTYQNIDDVVFIIDNYNSQRVCIGHKEILCKEMVENRFKGVVLRGKCEGGFVEEQWQPETWPPVSNKGQHERQGEVHHLSTTTATLLRYTPQESIDVTTAQFNVWYMLLRRGWG